MLGLAADFGGFAAGVDCVSAALRWRNYCRLAPPLGKSVRRSRDIAVDVCLSAAESARIIPYSMAVVWRSRKNHEVWLPEVNPLFRSVYYL